jgi:hypothetical protein
LVGKQHRLRRVARGVEKALSLAESVAEPTPVSSFRDAQLLHITARYIGATVSVYDSELIFRFVSGGFAQWFGLQPHQIVGHTLADCYHESSFTRHFPY